MRPTTCIECTTPLLPGPYVFTPAPEGHRYHAGHGQCTLCYSRARYVPTPRPSPLDRIEDIEWLLDQGATHHEVIARTDTKPASLYRFLLRNERTDLWERLQMRNHQDVR